MKALNLDAKTVSTRAGLGASFIRDIQRGKSREPKRSALERIAKVLGCSVSDLMGGSSPQSSPEQRDSTLGKLPKESDMAAAVVGGSLLEAALERLLRARLLTTNDQLLREIFGDRGPLADFRSKILIAQAFGLVTSAMAHELYLVQEVRNTFVHSRDPVKFDDPLIDDRISELRVVQGLRKLHPARFSGTSKQLYLFEIEILQAIFEETRRNGGTADAVLADALSISLSRGSTPQTQESR
jgi:transcriptional regulator with XRE-family HTH domain